jgi:hypothetical protein
LIRNCAAVETSWQISCALPSKSARCRPRLDARAEATSLMVISAGPGIIVMAGQRSPDDARILIGYDLDRLLSTPQPVALPKTANQPSEREDLFGRPPGRVGDHP